MVAEQGLDGIEWELEDLERGLESRWHHSTCHHLTSRCQHPVIVHVGIFPSMSSFINVQILDTKWTMSESSALKWSLPRQGLLHAWLQVPFHLAKRLCLGLSSLRSIRRVWFLELVSILQTPRQESKEGNLGFPWLESSGRDGDKWRLHSHVNCSTILSTRPILVHWGPNCALLGAPVLELSMALTEE